MSHLYIWKPTNKSSIHTKKKFNQALLKQKALYEEAYLIPFQYQMIEIAGTYIGQITWEQHIREWSPWSENDKTGVAWAGIAENLSTPNPDDLFHLLNTTPEKLTDFDGSFALCSWNQETASVLFVTAPTQSPSLFFTEGPEGFAIGSRGGPLLELVGRKAEVDRVQASLYISWVYLIGDGSLYENVHRLKSRSIVELTNEQISIKRYQKLSDLIKQPEKELKSNVIIEEAKKKLLSRVKRQLDLSEHPVI